MPLTFSDERGAGTFHSLGALPKRKHQPVFHIPPHDSNDDIDNDHEHPQSVPFPRSPSPPSPPRPQLSRGTSTPILSKGKPLKSSLKSSPSTSTICMPPEAQHLHLRARSEPATPAKNVHFPEKDYGLATVRVFRCSARPAAVSSPANGNGDETETEGEDTPPVSYPFPPAHPAMSYEIDPTKSSAVPCKSASPPHVILESLCLSPCSSIQVSLAGSILVSNLAFKKNVAVRFTLDDWQIVSEVGARYVDSLSLLPSHILPPSTTCHPRARGWDRFNFTIRLGDYVHSLSTRTLWLALRYRIDSSYPEPGSAQDGPGGEWWDNNRGNNYCIVFRPAVNGLKSVRGTSRRETVSEPVPPLRIRSLPIPCRERTSTFSVPCVPNEAATDENDRQPVPVRSGKLSLSNYARPTVATTSSVPFRSPRNLSSPSMTNPDLPTSHSDDDTASPASSTLSTPSVSPTMAPRVIINGQPATSVQPDRLDNEDDGSLRPGHIADWDWSASSGKLRRDIEALSRERADLDHVPGLVDPPERLGDMTPQGRRGSPGNKSLYDAFVTQWCFAQGPPPNRGYSDGGIMA